MLWHDRLLTEWNQIPIRTLFSCHPLNDGNRHGVFPLRCISACLYFHHLTSLYPLGKVKNRKTFAARSYSFRGHPSYAIVTHNIGSTPIPLPVCRPEVAAQTICYFGTLGYTSGADASIRRFSFICCFWAPASSNITCIALVGEPSNSRDTHSDETAGTPKYLLLDRRHATAYPVEVIR